MFGYSWMKMEMFVLNTNDNCWLTIIEDKNHSKIHEGKILKKEKYFSLPLDEAQSQE